MSLFGNWLRNRKLAKQREEKRKEELQASVAERLALMKEYYTVHLIEADRIAPSLPDPAKNEDLRALCASIRRYGLIEPLAVRRVSSDASQLGGLYTLIAGRRRFAALKALGITKIPCVILNIKASDTERAVLSAKLSSESPSLLKKAELSAAVCEAAQQDVFRGDDLPSSISCDEQTWKAICDCRRLSDEERTILTAGGLNDRMIADLAAIEDPEKRKQAIFSIANSCITIARNAERERKGGRRMLFNDITPLCNSVDRLVNTLRLSGVPASWNKSVSDERYELRILVPRRTFRLVNDRSEERFECIRTGTKQDV